METNSHFLQRWCPLEAGFRGLRLKIMLQCHTLRLLEQFLSPTTDTLTTDTLRATDNNWDVSVLTCCMFTRIHFLTSSYDHLTVLFILFVFLTSKALIQSLNNFYVFVLDRGVMNLKVLIWLRLVFFIVHDCRHHLGQCDWLLLSFLWFIRCCIYLKFVITFLAFLWWCNSGSWQSCCKRNEAFDCNYHYFLFFFFIHKIHDNN